jgi:hypothetical protein
MREPCVFRRHQGCCDKVRQSQRVAERHCRQKERATARSCCSIACPGARTWTIRVLGRAADAAIDPRNDPDNHYRGRSRGHSRSDPGNGPLNESEIESMSHFRHQRQGECHGNLLTYLGIESQCHGGSDCLSESAVDSGAESRNPGPSQSGCHIRSESGGRHRNKPYSPQGW